MLFDFALINLAAIFVLSRSLSAMICETAHVMQYVSLCECINADWSLLREHRGLQMVQDLYLLYLILMMPQV